MGKRLAKKILLIGWDAADWKVITPLLEQGRMPALESIINNGVMGKIATLDPPLSPMLWTSISTGKRADKHGILGFIEPDPITHNVRPVRVTSRKVKAVWNILNQHHLKTHVVGWWPGHPAEPVNGIYVSNFYQRATTPFDKPWHMIPGTVHPADMQQFFSELRIHPQELTEEHILPFIPRAAEVDHEKDKSLATIARITAENATIHAAATWMLENREWDFAAVYYDGIDHYSHAFMKFYPPRRKGIPEKIYEMRKDVVSGGYIFHDMMLGRLLKLAGDDATVILVSDHGFHSDHLRPHTLPKEPAAPAHEHSPYGIICMKGPGIKKDERIYGASILDISPTVLTMFGLPVGRDMDGKVLSQAFSEQIEIEAIESWENIPGSSGMHPPEAMEETYNTQEEMQQLVDLGYIEPLSKDKEKNLKNATNESRFYLARSHISGRKYSEAIEVLEKLHGENPDVFRYASKLAQCYLDTNQPEKCLKVLNAIREKLPKEKHASSLVIMEASVLHLSGNSAEAYNKLVEAEKNANNSPYYHQSIGKLYLQLSKYWDAERVFNNELAINLESATAFHGLGVALLRQGKPALAAENLLKSINLVFNFPVAHYHLAESLMKMRYYDRAKEALNTCIAMAPQLKVAHDLLRKLEEKEKDKRPPEIAESRNDNDFIVVVSGLPRSGTSMMMNMLKEGGLPIFTDENRKADADNPKGYFEHEAVKKSAENISWVMNAKGKVVKVVSNLLFYLPDPIQYKVIFMQRDIHEILESQEIMLQRKKKLPPKSAFLRLEKAFRQNLKRAEVLLATKRNMQFITVHYRDVIDNPERECERISNFLKLPLEIEKMKISVDPALYRIKKWLA